MSELKRPGPCDFCDADPSSGDMRGVCIGITRYSLSLPYQCAIYRRWWDAGFAAGARSERAAQAIESQEAYGKEWI